MCDVKKDVYHSITQMGFNSWFRLIFKNFNGIRSHFRLPIETKMLAAIHQMFSNETMNKNLNVVELLN